MVRIKKRNDKTKRRLKRKNKVLRASKKKTLSNWSSSCGIKSLNEYHGGSFISTEANKGVAVVKEGKHEALAAKTSVNAEYGPGGAIVEADASATYYTFKDDDVGELNVLDANVGAGLGIGAGGVKAKAEVSVDLVKAKAKLGKNQELSANLGLSADTGFEAGIDGVGVSFLGFGVSAGRKTGFSTPFGSVSLKFW